MFMFAGVGALAGSPIHGQLLGNTFVWSKSIIFAAVSGRINSLRCCVSLRAAGYAVLGHSGDGHLTGHHGAQEGDVAPLKVHPPGRSCLSLYSNI